MKQKDIALIIVVCFISAVLSFIISMKVFVTPANRQQSVPVIDAIDGSFTKPSSKYFNDQSINPTQQIHVTDNANQNPFKAPTGNN